MNIFSVYCFSCASTLHFRVINLTFKLDMGNVESYLRMVKNQFHSTWALLLLILLLLLIFKSLDSLFLVLNNGRFLIYGSVIIIGLAYWSTFRYRLPRNKKGKVGVVIALYCESEKEKSEIKADFFSKIYKKMREENLLGDFHLIFLKNHLSEQLKNSEKPAELIVKFNKKINAHYFVWGEVKKREDGEIKYFFELNGYVVHKPIPQNLSRDLSIDFSKVLPKQLEFLEKQQLKGFEISAGLVYLSIKYIIGVAAFVSGDLILAERLHQNLYIEFNSLKPLPDHLRAIRTKAFNFFVEEKFLIALVYHRQGVNAEKVEENIQRVLTHNPSHYGALLLKTQLEFLKGNVDGSLVLALRARDCAPRDSTWRYSLAFLYFWNCQFAKALTLCKQIRQQNYAGESKSIQEVIDFNLKLLKMHPEKTQLYFWIGYLAYFKNQDLANALVYFENSLEKGVDSVILNQKAKAYLIEIKRHMQICEGAGSNRALSARRREVEILAGNEFS